MASNQMCGPCSRVNKLSSAAKFCTDCEDPLCLDCVTMHKAIKSLALHHLIDKEVQTDKAFSLKRTCSDHPDMALEFYCSNHEYLCCRTCSVNTHRRCGKILPIDVAARGINTSVMLNDVTADLKALLKTAEELEEDRAKNKENIGKAKATTLQTIVKFKRQIIQELDELEKKLLTEIDQTEKNLTIKAESELSDIEIRCKAIVDLSEQLEFLTKHGSEIQILMLLNTIRVDISKQENDFQNLVPSYKCIDVSFKASEKKSALTYLGSIEIKSAPCSIEHKPSKHAQAQIPPEYVNMPTKFKLKNEFQVPYSNGSITSMLVTNDNRILLCHSGDKSKALSIWSETGDHIQDCSLAGTAWGIAIIPGTNEAVVTLPNIGSIQFVNISRMVPGKSMKVPDDCHGVTVIKDLIVLGGVRKVYFFKSPGFNGPIGMVLDGKYNLYVTSWRSNTVHRLTKDGKLLDILLKKENGLDVPYDVAFNKNYTKLYIVNGTYITDKQVLIFDCA